MEKTKTKATQRARVKALKDAAEIVRVLANRAKAGHAAERVSKARREAEQVNAVRVLAKCAEERCKARPPAKQEAAQREEAEAHRKAE